MTKRKSVLTFIDGDPVVYACGFASEHRLYVAIDDQSGDSMYTEPHEGLRAMKEAIGDTPATIYERVSTEPVANALNSVKKNLAKIIETVEAWAKRECEPQLLLTGSGNFRERIATIKPYKGTRKPWHKPRHEQAIKRYMVDNCFADVIYGQEADDELAIRQTAALAAGHPSVIVTIDKDLLMVPGWHYNPVSGKFKKTSPEEGMLRFYRPVLTGDTVDNIMGCYKLGPTRAREIILSGMTQREMWIAVRETFRENVAKYPEHYPNGMAGEEAALETAQLVWMRRKQDELWSPPDA